MAPKRPHALSSRLDETFEEEGLRNNGDDEASASHLVSFLTGYDTVQPHDDNEGSDEDEDGQAWRSDEDQGDYADEDDPDADEEDMEATPTKRSKTGLVGTPGTGRSRSRSTRTTPSKRKTPTSTPRKPKTPALGVAGQDEAGGEGFIRMSRADAYFLSHSRSAKTSGNSYSSLVKPLSQAQYDKYATSSRSKGKGKAVVDSMMTYHRMKFDQWVMELEDGFNIQLYGFGSKRRLMNHLVMDRLCDLGHCVVVNGHFPGLGIRDVLSQIEDTLSVPQDIPVPSSPSTPLDRLAHRIYAYFLPAETLPPSKARSSSTAHSVAEKPLFLVIHNLDSPSLRSPRSLALLSLLACSPRIHIIASFDHVHTPILFSTSQSTTPPHAYAAGSWTGTPLPERGFKWVYHNTTTYDDYDLELTYQRLTSKAALGGISSSASTGISEEGALQILRSVPPMALRLLKLLMLRQIGALPPDPKLHVAHGLQVVAPVFAMDNDTLQRLSREKFIAREEERYNALIGEFKDHGLVVEAGLDGEGRTGRWVWIPLGKSAIERVLETVKEVDI